MPFPAVFSHATTSRSLAMSQLRTFLISLFCFLAGAVSCFSQELPNGRRFKHEKNGAIVFASGEDYELKCDLYIPDADTPRPVMLAIHGGAWRTGTKFSMYRHARILANRGYAVMAINYRLAPEHKWPAQIHDCKHAVRWIRKHAKKYNIDADRVYAYGYSAGGHLAALLAMTDADDGLEGEVEESLKKFDSRIQGVILGGSPLDFSWIDEDATTLNYWLGSTKANQPETYDQASPCNYVTSDDPVTIVYHGTTDALVPTSSPQAFVKTCRKENVPVELLMTGSGHIGAFSDTTLFLKCLMEFEAKLDLATD